MKKIFIILIVTAVATALGLYFRPSYALIGQLDWWNVLSKGYFVGGLSGLIGQSFLDESFFYVMRFTGAGLVMGIFMAIFLGKKK